MGAQTGVVTQPGVGVGAQPGVVIQPGVGAQTGVVTQPGVGVGAQPGVVIQPGVVAQPGVVSQSGAAFQQPTYWAVPSGSNPPGVVTVPYSAATPQGENQAQVQVIMHEYITV